MSNQVGNGDPTESNVQDVIASLTSKRVKLSEWIQKAWSFYNQNEYEGFFLLLESSIARGSRAYPGFKDDLLRVHTMLAAHFVRLACSEHGHRRALWQEKVAQQLQVMDNLQVVSNDVQHLLCRGFALMVTESRLQEADNHFVSVLRQMPQSVPALLGRACLAYNRQEYRVALGYFKSVLIHQPHGPADVRVGIAHCFLRLGNLDSARRAFEMAVQRNGRCINALLGIAQLKLNERQRAANMEATNLLCAAFELNNRHPVVLSWLACYLYYSRNYGKLQTAAGNAYLITDNPELKAQNCFQIARSFHATKNFDRAFDFYGKALKCLLDYAPPHLGIAQIYVRRGQLDMAEHSLRSLLKLLPENSHGLRMLGTLYAQDESPAKLDKAIQLFKSALERSARDDYDTWLSLGNTYERQQHWQQAIDAYEHAIEIYTRLPNTPKDTPLTWLNNVAALQLHAEQPEAALKTLDKALASEPTEPDSEFWESDMLTVRFNRARVLEELHLADQAESSYKQLIAEYPTYYDSYLRLGVMASKRNQVGTAMDYFKAVLQLEIDNVAARTFLGNLYAKQGALSQAMYNYNVIMRRPGSFGDSYMLVAVGNVCLVKVQRCMANGQLEMARQYQENALQLFRKALEQNQRNLWAANGIGVALSNHGHLTDGEAIFKQIVESSKRCTAAVLNTAHIAMELNHYSEAIDIYVQCLKNFLPANSVKEMQLLARAFYQTGQFVEARHLLLKARHVAPHDPHILYNLAIVMKQSIRNTFQAKRSDLSYLKRAEAELEIAETFFQYLCKKENSLKGVHKQANKCSKLLEDVVEELKSSRKFEEISKSRQREKAKKAKGKHSVRRRAHSKGRKEKDSELDQQRERKERSRKKHSSRKREEKTINTDNYPNEDSEKRSPDEKSPEKSKPNQGICKRSTGQLERCAASETTDHRVVEQEEALEAKSKAKHANKPRQQQKGDKEDPTAKRHSHKHSRKRHEDGSEKAKRESPAKAEVLLEDKQLQLDLEIAKAISELQDEPKEENTETATSAHKSKSRKRKHRSNDLANEAESKRGKKQKSEMKDKHGLSG